MRCIPEARNITIQFTEIIVLYKSLGSSDELQ